MKNVRLWFTKDGAARYISHLDLNRCIMRAIYRSKLPVWYTEGFNPHPFVTFALPLSLGFRGKRESMDIRLLQELSKEEIIYKMNACLPKGIRIFDATKPKMKPGQISYALFTIRLSSEGYSSETVKKELLNLLSQDEIMVEKKSKSGTKQVNLKEKIKKYHIIADETAAVMQVLLSAGSTANVNPNLLLEALCQSTGYEIEADITREEVYNERLEPFG